MVGAGRPGRRGRSVGFGDADDDPPHRRRGGRRRHRRRQRRLPARPPRAAGGPARTASGRPGRGAVDQRRARLAVRAGRPGPSRRPRTRRRPRHHPHRGSRWRTCRHPHLPHRHRRHGPAGPTPPGPGGGRRRAARRPGRAPVGRGDPRPHDRGGSRTRECPDDRSHPLRGPALRRRLGATWGAAPARAHPDALVPHRAGRRAVLGGRRPPARHRSRWRPAVPGRPRRPAGRDRHGRGRGRRVLHLRGHRDRRPRPRPGAGRLPRQRPLQHRPPDARRPAHPGAVAGRAALGWVRGDPPAPPLRPLHRTRAGPGGRRRLPGVPGSRVGHRPRAHRRPAAGRRRGRTGRSPRPRPGTGAVGLPGGVPA